MQTAGLALLLALFHAPAQAQDEEAGWPVADARDEDVVTPADAPASTAPPSETLAERYDVRSRLQVLAYGQWLQLRDNSLLNPGNIAGIATESGALEVRLDGSAGTDWLRIFANPRLRVEEGEGVSATEPDLFLSQGGVAVATPIDALELSVQRHLLSSGPANFRSPGNPFYFDNGRSNPIQELSGIDLARLQYAPAAGISSSVAYVISGGHDDRRVDDIADAVFLDFDYAASTWGGRLVAGRLNGADAGFLGTHLQGSISDAVLLYAEASLKEGSRALYPLADPAAFPHFGQRYAQSHRYFHSFLVGGSYTAASGHTLYLEFLRNNEGYDATEAALYYGFVREAANVTRGRSEGDPQAAVVTLRQALGTGLPLLRRNYAFLQLQNNPFEDLIWQLRLTLNLDDDSGQVSVYAESSLLDKLSAYALLAGNFGAESTESTEYGELVRGSAIVGVKLFMF